MRGSLLTSFVLAGAAVALGTTVVFEREAEASPSAKLVYVRGAGADSCPGEAELRKAVALRLGYDPFFPVAQKTVIAQVQRAPSGFTGRVQIVGDDGNIRGERELATKGDDCKELALALALAVSLALDDLDEAPAKPPAKPDEPPPPPPPPPPPRDPPPVVTEPKDDGASRAPIRVVDGPSMQLAASLGPIATLGTAPDIAAGASLAIALRWPASAFALRLDVRSALPSSKSLAQGGKVSTNDVVGTVAACLRGTIPFGCVGGGAGVLFSRTENITRPASDRASLLVGVARGGADIALGARLYLEPFAEVGLNVLSRAVEVDGRTVYETSPVWAAVGIHLGGRFL